jgi:hypothetical protein
VTINQIRGLILAANILLIGLIGWAGYQTFYYVDPAAWEVEAPKYEKYTPPAPDVDARQREQANYKVIGRVFDPPAPKVDVAPVTQQARPTADVSKLQVMILNYDPRDPSRCSALLTGQLAGLDPSTRQPACRYFYPGQDLGIEGLQFEAYKGAKVKEITEKEVILLDQQGKEVRLPAPAQATAAKGAG